MRTIVSTFLFLTFAIQLVPSRAAAAACQVFLRSTVWEGQTVPCPVEAQEQVIGSNGLGQATVRTLAFSADSGAVSVRHIDVGSLQFDTVSPGASATSVFGQCEITGPPGTIQASMNLEIGASGSVPSYLAPVLYSNTIIVSVSVVGWGANLTGTRVVKSTSDPLNPFSTTGSGIFAPAVLPPAGGEIGIPTQIFQSAPGSFNTNESFNFILTVTAQAFIAEGGQEQYASVDNAFVRFPTNGQPVLNLPSGYSLNCSEGPVVDGQFLGTTAALPNLCGTGSIEPTETCDDGGTVGGDGCSDLCEIEPGYFCAGEPSICTTAPPVPAGSSWSRVVIIAISLAMIGFGLRRTTTA